MIYIRCPFCPNFSVTGVHSSSGWAVFSPFLMHWFNSFEPLETTGSTEPQSKIALVFILNNHQQVTNSYTLYLKLVNLVVEVCLVSLLVFKVHQLFNHFLSNRNLPDVTAEDFSKVNLSQFKWIHFEVSLRSRSGVDIGVNRLHHTTAVVTNQTDQTDQTAWISQTDPPATTCLNRNRCKRFIKSLQNMISIRHTVATLIDKHHKTSSFWDQDVKFNFSNFQFLKQEY